jgi:iron(III) transport system substrate-binding protein
MKRRPLFALPVLALALAACGDDDGGGSGDTSAPPNEGPQCDLEPFENPRSIVLYNGRSEELVGPAIEIFEEGTGIDVEIKSGGSGDLALLIDTEGSNTPADVFFSQAPGPLGYLDGKGRFAPLPADVLSRVPAAYAAPDGDWVGVSGRVRVLVYASDRVDAATLPGSYADLTGPAYKDKVGVAPTNASFQDWVSYLRTVIGDDATLDYLRGLEANGAKTYANNTAVVDAVNRGEIDYGLVNHYYNYQFLAQDPGTKSVNHFFPNGDPGSVVLAAGAAILDESDHKPEAEAFVRYLLSDCAQQYFAEETYEYPLVPGVPPVADLPPLDSLAAPTPDLALLGEQFSSTVQMIEDSGLRV